MKYNPSLGIMGNIRILFNERNKTNNEVFNNKIDANNKFDGLAEENEVLYEIEADQEFRICCLEMGMSPEDFEEVVSEEPTEEV